MGDHEFYYEYFSATQFNIVLTVIMSMPEMYIYIYLILKDFQAARSFIIDDH